MAQMLQEHDNDGMNEDTETNTMDSEKAPTFTSDWNNSDTTLLHPGRLDRTKPLRAWERKPTSPYTKQRLRVGKVWKRAGVGKKDATVAERIESKTLKRLRAGEGTQSPLKIIKRLCLGPNEGVGLSWDRVESPRKRNARIITRSSRVAEELVALSEEEGERGDDGQSGGLEENEEVEGTVIEFLDEQGQAMGPEESAEEGWADVYAPEPDETHDGTLMHASEAVQYMGPARVSSDKTVGFAPETDEGDLSGRSQRDKDPDAVQKDLLEIPKTVTGYEVAHNVSTATNLNEKHTLPEGFVSPAKRRRPGTRTQKQKAAAAARRQTLPLAFTPVDALHPAPAAVQSDSAIETLSGASRAEEMHQEDLATLIEEPLRDGEHNEVSEAQVAEQEAGEGGEWQDISEDEEEPAEAVEEDEEDVFLPKQTSEAMPLESETEGAPAPQQDQQDLPVLQGRKSARRKTSTPLKQSSLRSVTDAPHILAFSPVKRPHRYPSPPPSSNNAHLTLPSQEDVTMSDLAQPAQSPHLLERSTSAPPEEPHISPRKTAKPRISDDTAFIQAFLSRAEESKASRLAAENRPARLVSAHKRESLSNRRDSDTVRQALASPAKAEILGDLDPNSPSPKKISASEQPTDGPTNVLSANTADEEDQKPRRRSIRDRRRPGRAAAATSNTISLRGLHDPVVLKRTEVQELANVTRANTRKNKGASIMPILRLTKLAAEKPSVDVEAGAEDEESGLHFPAENVRGVRWDQTLAYYQEAPVEPEIPLLELGDSGKAVKIRVQGSDALAGAEDEHPAPAPVPAAETPSKPKIRKLPARRTAAVPGEAPAPTKLDPDAADESKATKRKQKGVQKSRIATPGKTLTAPSNAASAGPPSFDLDPSLLPKPQPPARKKLASRLPAPAPVNASARPGLPSSSVVSNTGAMEGQNLIASPAKRKTAPPTSVPVPPADGAVSRLALGRSKLGLPAQGPPASGLMSPAKKPSKIVGFAASGGESGNGEAEKRERSFGLSSSPAKKRVRRAG